MFFLSENFIINAKFGYENPNFGKILGNFQKFGASVIFPVRICTGLLSEIFSVSRKIETFCLDYFFNAQHRWSSTPLVNYWRHCCYAILSNA